jgi:two-component system, NarL family, sensor histidine kinase EvgS
LKKIIHFYHTIRVSLTLLGMLIAILGVFTLLLLSNAALAVPMVTMFAEGKGAEGFVPTPEQRQWLSNKTTLRVATVNEWMPVDVAQGEGIYTGLSGDYTQLLARRLGLTIELQRFANMDGLLAAAREGKIDLIPSLAKTRERAEFISYSRPFLDLNSAVFARRDSPALNQVGDWRGVKIAVERGFSTVDYLRSTYAAATLVLKDDTDGALRAVARGDADVYVGALLTTVHRLDRLQLANLEVRSQLKSPFWLLHMGVPHASTDHNKLLEMIDAAMASVSRDEARTIEQRWIAAISSIRFAPDGLLLSEQQQAWRKKNNTIRVAYDPEMHLISQTGDGGRMRGVGVDFLALAIAKLGMAVIEEKSGDWPTIIEAARRGEVDVLVAAAKTQERLAEFDFAGPYLTARTVIVDRIDSLAHYSLVDLTGRKVAIVKEHFLVNQIRQNHPSVELVFFPTLTGALESVERGETVAAIGNIYAISNLLTTRFLGSL